MGVFAPVPNTITRLKTAGAGVKVVALFHVEISAIHVTSEVRLEMVGKCEKSATQKKLRGTATSGAILSCDKYRA